MPAVMQDELRVWFSVMRKGSATAPRRQPRDDRTTRTQLRNALPAIRTWARRCRSPREVSREDVRAALPATGESRILTLTGLRSILGILKARRLVFVNPTSRVHAKKPNFAPIAPVDLTRSARRARFR